MIVISRTLHKDRVGHGKETGGEERGGGQPRTLERKHTALQMPSRCHNHSACNFILISIFLWGLS